jgi:hypothetical protein
MLLAGLTMLHGLPAARAAGKAHFPALHSVAHDDPPVAPSAGGDDSYDDPPIRYHLYDPKSLLAFSNCRSHFYGNRKHSLDKLFIHQLMLEGGSVPPEQADVFVGCALLS